MPTVKAPIYSKIPNATTGAMDPCYTFNIEFAPSEPSITFIAEDHVSLQMLQKHVVEQITLWTAFMTHFLQATAKHFSKPYTVDQIHKLTKHALAPSVQSQPTAEFPAQITCTPASIQISGGVFLVQWNVTCAPILIDIPVVDETPTETPIETLVIPDIGEELEELNVADVPLDENTTELELDTPTKFYDKQKVKEARLKAKLAMYKAQHQLSSYYEKYGQDLSDSDEDTSDEDTSDEEIQL